MIRPQFKNGELTVFHILLITEVFVRDDEQIESALFSALEQLSVADVSCDFQNRNFVCEQNRTGSEDGDME